MSYYDLSYRYKYEAVAVVNNLWLQQTVHPLSATCSCHGPLRPDTADGGPPRGGVFIFSCWSPRHPSSACPGLGSVHQGRRQ